MNKNFTLTNGKTIAQVEQEMKHGLDSYNENLDNPNVEKITILFS